MTLSLSKLSLVTTPRSNVVLVDWYCESRRVVPIHQSNVFALDDSGSKKRVGTRQPAVRWLIDVYNKQRRPEMIQSKLMQSDEDVPFSRTGSLRRFFINRVTHLLQWYIILHFWIKYKPTSSDYNYSNYRIKILRRYGAAFIYHTISRKWNDNIIEDERVS